MRFGSAASLRSSTRGARSPWIGRAHRIQHSGCGLVWDRTVSLFSCSIKIALLWDRLLIGRGLAALARSEKLGRARGLTHFRASIAACHARALVAEETDWARIAELYGELAQLTPTPVVELNRAVAVSMAFGPEAGLVLVDALVSEQALAGYHLCLACEETC